MNLQAQQSGPKILKYFQDLEVQPFSVDDKFSVSAIRFSVEND